jgi:tetratricopeptide (TPR) repeat protein
MPVPPEKPEPMPPPKPRVPPPEAPPPPRPMVPDPDPKVEYDRLITLGRDSFATQEYARAARRFRQATVVVPGNPLAHFLLAQAEFAIGKFREAVAAIHAGMKLQEDWPGARFRPLDLYGVNVADYPEQLLHLEETLAGRPDDPVLVFLYAYQLWFDGRRDEAVPLFRRAAGLVADPTFIRRFLANQRDVPVV